MTDLSFLSAPGMAAGFVAETRPRAHGAGVDLYEYDRVTAPLESLLQWPEACREAALLHRAAAERAAGRGRTRTAGERHRLAARWFHLAGLIPDPDRARAAELAREADRSMEQSLALLEPQARRLSGDGFAGWLRPPADAGPQVGGHVDAEAGGHEGPQVGGHVDAEAGGHEGPEVGGKRFPVAVVIPGMDSAKEEFHAVADALLARGVAVLAIDGPGQGVMGAGTVLDATGHRSAVTRALDALAEVDSAADGWGLDLGRIAVVGLSLGGYLAAAVAAHDPRVRAAVLVSGPYRLEWDGFVPFVTATLGLRCGGPDAARDFADRLDLAALAPQLRGPLLLVEGGDDRIPGMTNAEALAADLPHAEVLHVPYGNHLLGNAPTDWLSDTADWLAEALLTV
ncbi:alpha/beta hydrolase family protein [Kitasatospora griseola]|uniref:alpha/beta hydrolase family protein n=1 Tax=Kitasatospora griseola TaxID=2064 RepID=UPI000695FBEB|nr:alpha/beta fold hydrolase [Kitasatospora griseola]